MKETIKKIDVSGEFRTSELCYLLELSNTPDDPEVSIARARIPVGVTTVWHRLTTTIERYVLLEGRGIVEIGDLAPQEVGPGDVVIIPPMCRQRITNIGENELIFLAICTPRFLPEEYEDLETGVRGERRL